MAFVRAERSVFSDHQCHKPAERFEQFDNGRVLVGHRGVTWGPIASEAFLPPAWSISAEAAAYIAFPLIIWLGLARSTIRAIGLIAAGVAGYFAIEASFGTIHVIDGRAPLRSISGFIIGVGMWRLSQDMAFASSISKRSLEALAAVIFVVTVTIGNPPIGFLISGLVFIFAISDGAGPSAWLLQTRPFAMLGRLSFSVYLWHWFIIAFLQGSQSAFTALEAVFMLGALTIGLLMFSELSFRFLERPAGAYIKSKLSADSAANRRQSGVGRLVGDQP